MLPIVLFALACTETLDGPLTDEASSDTESGDTYGSDTEDPDDGESDEEVARALIDGTTDVSAARSAITWGDGFPVHTSDDTWLFFQFEDGSWSLAGDHGDWALEPMTEADGFSWIEVSIGSPEGSLYKFVDSSGDYEADPFARSYGYDSFGEFSYVAPPTDTWRLDRWPGLEAEGLAERTLRVYVPAGTGPWPVLYAQDGQNLFDPDAIWGGWMLQDAIASVGEDVLVAALDNTSDRMDEYTHVADSVSGISSTGEGDAYAALVHEHVRPHIEDVYGSSGLDGLMGSSLGGLISLHIAQTYDGEYDFVASLSGTLGWGAYSYDNPTMEALYVAQGLGSAVVYVDSGGGPGDDGVCSDEDGDGYVEDDEDASDNYCVTRQFADTLADDVGYTWDDNLFHWWEPDADHNEMEWAARVDLPLSLFTSLDD